MRPYRKYIIGLVAQLGERCVRNAEAEGSIPFKSTSGKITACDFAGNFIKTEFKGERCLKKNSRPEIAA